MALNYSTFNNKTYSTTPVYSIKKGDAEYLIKDPIASAAIEVIQGDETTEGSIEKAKADAKLYAEGLVNALSSQLSGVDANTLTLINSIKKELTGDGTGDDIISYLDVVKTVLGVNATGQSISFTVNGVNTYTTVSDAISALETYANSLITGLDSSQSQTAADANGNVEASITLADGKVTALSVDASSLKSSISNKIGDVGNNTVKQYVDTSISNSNSISDGVLTLTS